MQSTVRSAPASCITAWIVASEGDTLHDCDAAMAVNDRLSASHGNEPPKFRPSSSPPGSSAPHGLPVIGFLRAGSAPVAGFALAYDEVTARGLVTSTRITA